jgi:RecJ-like exonuclease
MNTETKIECPICHGAGEFPHGGECIQCGGNGHFESLDHVKFAMAKLGKYNAKHPGNFDSKARYAKLKALIPATPSVTDHKLNNIRVWNETFLAELQERSGVNVCLNSQVETIKKAMAKCPELGGTLLLNE